MIDKPTRPPAGLRHIRSNVALAAAALVGQLMLPHSAHAAEDMLTQSAKWMKISGYIIGTAVACGISESEATPVGSKVIDNTAHANGNTISKTALAEIHVKTFLGAIKMQKKIGSKGCDVAISKFERLKASP